MGDDANKPLLSLKEVKFLKIKVKELVLKCRPSRRINHRCRRFGVCGE